MGYIYRITNRINGKCYIGQTVNYVRRWAQHKHPKNECVKLRNAMAKYGVGNFRFQIICVCFDDAMNAIEEEYIKRYDSVKGGYNVQLGGRFTLRVTDEMREAQSRRRKGKKHSPETRSALSKRMRELQPFRGRHHTVQSKTLIGEKSRRYWSIKENREAHSRRKKGYKHTPEARSAMSKRMRENNPFRGRRHTEKTKAIISEKNRGAPGPWLGKRLTDAHKSLLREKRRGVFKAVEQLSKSGDLIARFDSLADASRHVGVDDAAISRVCMGKQHTSMGFLWRWAVQDTSGTPAV